MSNKYFQVVVLSHDFLNNGNNVITKSMNFDDESDAVLFLLSELKGTSVRRLEMLLGNTYNYEYEQLVIYTTKCDEHNQYPYKDCFVSFYDKCYIGNRLEEVHCRLPDDLLNDILQSDFAKDYVEMRLERDQDIIDGIDVAKVV